MQHRNAFGTLAVATLAILLSAGGAPAQQSSLKEQLLGTWTLTAIADVHENGKKVDDWGKSVGGAATFDANGHFTWMIIGGNLPTTSNSPRISNRMVVAYYGRYTVDEANRTITYTADRSTNPGFDRRSRTATLTLSGDDMMQHSTPIKTPRGTLIPEIVFKRAK